MTGRHARMAALWAWWLSTLVTCAPQSSVPPTAPDGSEPSSEVTPSPPSPTPAPAPAPTPSDVPFQLQLRAITGGTLPGLQGMIWATSGDQLVLVGGRINGLHGFPTQNRAASSPAFPRDQANDKAYLVQASTGKVIASASVSGLPSAVARQLGSTNAQFSVVGDTLYVVGGYGYTEDGKGMLTFQQALAIRLPAFIQAIQGGALDAAFAAESIYMGSDRGLAITGGAMEPATLIGNEGFLLIFGQKYEGAYSTGGGTATQTYSESVRQFQLTTGATGKQSGKPVGQLTVTTPVYTPPISRSGPTPDAVQYHRRDLTVLPLLSPQGQGRIAALGGVFVPGQTAGFVNPIYIQPKAGGTGIDLVVDTATTQWLSQYETAVVPVYSASRQAMYVTLFGGISQYYWQDGKLQRDTPNFNVTPAIDSLPFIDSVSTLRSATTGTQQFLHDGQTFPPAGAAPACGADKTAAPYLGAETVFVPTAGALDASGVIQLDTLSAPTVVGYLVGGIAALAPYPDGKTCASNAYFQVTLVPDVATPTTLLQGP